jgi:glycosyltransferase involved in cell wall biosynthesis
VKLPRVGLVGPVPPELGGATPGGVATHQAHLAEGLVQHGLDAHLLATNTRVDEPGEASVHTSSGIPMVRMCSLRWSNPASLRAVGTRPLARYALHLARTPAKGSRGELLSQLLWYRYFLRSVRPALVHVQHPLERHRLVRAVQQLEGLRLPVVVTAHSFFGEHLEEVIQTLMAPNLRTADRVIAVSPHVADQAIQLGASAERVRVIRSGVDTERFRPRDRLAARQRLQLERDRPLVLFVGNLEPRKQLHVLLRALPRLRAAVPRILLAVIGSGASAGQDDQTAVVNRLADELGLRQAVRFLGSVAADELLAWYAAADVLALPSSSEAQGIVALEAMASGLPVVASAVGGLLGTIEDGRTGYLVPAGDAAALADRLSVLLADPAGGMAIGAAARAAVERDFSWARAVAATIDVYCELLGCP